MKSKGLPFAQCAEEIPACFDGQIACTLKFSARVRNEDVARFATCVWGINQSPGKRQRILVVTVATRLENMPKGSLVSCQTRSHPILKEKIEVRFGLIADWSLQPLLPRHRGTIRVSTKRALFSIWSGCADAYQVLTDSSKAGYESKAYC